jgi:hypothetical protein
MKLLVCGGRDFKNWTYLKEYLDGFHFKQPISEIIHGAAPGADSLAGNWALLNHIPVRRFAAQWDRFGKHAGPIRNQQMLNEAQPDVVIAFPGGPGTANMKFLARKSNILVIDVEMESITCPR